VEAVRRHFGQELGCQVEELLLLGGKLSRQEIAKKILGTDIIYVGGGNTLLMMKAWRKSGTDKVLERAWKKGIVMAGLSAGSICWFRDGMSDAIKRSKDAGADYIKVRGLGLIPALHCPHYDFEKAREQGLREMMRRTPGVALALENCAALEIIDDTYRVLVSRRGAKAYAIFWKEGAYYKTEIRQSAEFRPLAEILKK
jgi:dipeptidase E